MTRERWWVGVQAAAGVGGLVGLSEACGRLPGVPGSVAAMGVVFGALLVVSGRWPEVAEGMAQRMAPAGRWLGRWMTVFFVPTLVGLPVEALSWEVLWRLGVGAGAGQVLTLVAVALAVSSARAEAPADMVDAPATAARGEGGGPVRAGRWGGGGGGGAAAGCALGWEQAAGAALAVGAFGVAERARRAVEGRVGRWPAGARRVLLGALHPVLMSGAALWWVMRWAGDALGGARGADWLLWGLAPSVAALGLLLFAQRRALWAHAWRVVGVVGAGAALSLASAALMGAWLGLEGAAAASLLPRAVTTAVAVPLSEGLGGTPGLTVVALMVAGVMGAATGSPLLRALRVGQPWARGVAMGASAHALGTASLLEDDPDAAAFSGVAFALTGALTAALLAVPPFRAWLLAWCGL